MSQSIGLGMICDQEIVKENLDHNDLNVVLTPDDNIINMVQCAYVADLLSKMSSDIGEIDIAKRYDMVYNQYKMAWQDHYSKNEIIFCLTIPANMTAAVSLPDEQYQNMELGGKRCEYHIDLNNE